VGSCDEFQMLPLLLWYDLNCHVNEEIRFFYLYKVPGPFSGCFCSQGKRHHFLCVIVRLPMWTSASAVSVGGVLDLFPELM